VGYDVAAERSRKAELLSQLQVEQEGARRLAEEEQRVAMEKMACRTEFNRNKRKRAREHRRKASKVAAAEATRLRMQEAHRLAAAVAAVAAQQQPTQQPGAKVPSLVPTSSNPPSGALPSLRQKTLVRATFSLLPMSAASTPPPS